MFTRALRSLFLFQFLLSFSALHAFQVGVVLDRAGKDDKSFNTAAYNGAMKAKDELGVTVKIIEPRDISSYEPSMEMFAARKFDLVIGIGFAHKEAMLKVAKRHPQVHFGIVDAKVALPNVASLLFEEHEGSFLVGMAAALKSKTGVIGFVGGMDIPLIRRFDMAYQAGAKYANPKVKIVKNYVGITNEAFTDPTKAKELATAQISQGADVIFHAAGTSGLGVFDAAESKKILAIGVDANQNWIKPGIILTSMLKRVDVAVFDLIKSAKDGKFESGEHIFNLKNKGIDYATDEFNKNILDPGTVSKLEDAKKKILAGKISIPDYYKTKK